MIILGVDPGTTLLGYGFIDLHTTSSLRTKTGNSFSHVSHGCIEAPRNIPQGRRLQYIEEELTQLIVQHKPSAIGVETLYFSKNSKTAMEVSEARGVILLVAAKQNLSTHEFTPLQIKMTVTGYGKAEKRQMQRMVADSLGLPKIPKPDDAADALGVAITCSVFLKNSPTH